MKTKRTILAFIVIFTMLFSNVTSVYALPPLPSSINGTVKVHGVNVPAGTSITAWINGVQYASTTVVTYLGDTVYSLDIPGDESTTPTVFEGGVEGDTIVFHIGDLIAVETGTWHSGVPATVNISNPGYTLTVTSDHGTVTKLPDDTNYYDGEVVQLTAVPSSGWTFSNWTGGLTGSANPGSVTIHANTSVTANYTQGTFSLSVSKTGAGSGTITSSPIGVNCGSTCSYDFNAGTVVTLTASATSGSYFDGWSGEGCSGTGTCVVTMSAARSVSAQFKVTPVPTDLTCTNLDPKPATASTGEKPQSKVWNYGGSWYAVFPTNASGASSAGTWVWKLVGTTWTEVVKISTRTDTHADVLVDGSVAHILLWQDTNTQLSSIEFVGGIYQLWATRNTLVSISLPGSEIATIAMDSTDRMWLATRTSTGEIVVYHSVSPYSTWNGPITLETGVLGNDDISVITALPSGKIGVFWSNENPSVKRYGFRIHVDGDAPGVWATNEVPASQSAHDEIGIMSDDHMNLAVASDDTLYAAVKTSYDTAGYPRMALLVRRPNGTWDNMYPVDEAGTRPIVLLDEVHGFLTYIYTSAEGYNPIVYQQSSTASIAFDGRKTLRSASFNDVSDMKSNYNGEFVVIYASSTEVGGQYCTSDPAEGADLSITKTDSQVVVKPGDPITYTITATNTGPEAVVNATVFDTLPAALTGTTWTCVGAGGGTCPASGTGNINHSVSLPAGGSVTFTVLATLDGSASGTLVNTATITPPVSVTDPNPANNTSTDTDTITMPVTPCTADPNLVGCWQMEENGGSALLDGSTYANDAVLNGSPTWAAGKVDSYAIDLDGTSQYGLVADDASLDITSQITLATWIKPEQYGTQDLIKKATNGSVDGYELTLATTKTDATSQRPFFRINQLTNGDTYRVNALTMYPIDGTWMHVAGTYDGTTMRLYINGVLEGSLTPPAGTTIAFNDVPLTIGAQDGATASRWFMGWMDDARVYNRALTLNEIQALAGVSPTELLTINKDGTGSGTVTSSPSGIDCGTTCSFGFDRDAIVTLSATPAVGSTFTGWSDASCPGTGTCDVTMDAGKSVTATFAAIEYTLTVTSANGTVAKDPDQATYHYGDVVQLTATASAGWTFANWSGDATGSTNPVSVTIDGNKSVTANYTQNHYSLTVTSANGTVAKNPDQATYHYGDVVQLTATASTGWTFANWSGDATGSTNPVSVTIDGNKSVTANYTILTYLFSVNKTGTGTGTVTSGSPGINCGVDCSETYDHGTTVTLTAVPTSNYHRFVGWSGAGISCPGTGTCEVTITEAKTVSAEFEQSTFSDVPFDHPRWAYIEALYDNGYTAGCQAAGDPLKFCPEDTMLRAESAVFMLRGKLGAIPTPTDAEPYVFGDDWTSLEWAQAWSEKMWDEGMTAGCQWPAESTPKMFCPWTLFTREMGAVFALRIKHGSDMPVPPGSGLVFDDMTDGVYWGTGWAELAYGEGLIPACGTSNGKPLFCPQDNLDRSWSAYMIVLAKGLTLPE